MNIIKRQLANILRETANRIEAGTCELDEEQSMRIMSMIAHEPLSKDSACRYLDISRSKFDSMVREGKLPNGRKRRGFKELVWFRDELASCDDKMKR